MMTNNKTLGAMVARRCRDKRRELGISARDLALKIFDCRDDVSPGNRVYQYERRKGSMNLYTLWRIAEGLGVDWRELIPSSNSIRKGLNHAKK